MAGTPNTPSLQRATYGKFWFDIRDYASLVVQVPGHPPDWQPAIQAAIDAAQTAMGGFTHPNSAQAVVYVPSGTYTVYRPILMDQGGIKLKGEGEGFSSSINASSDFPVIMIGMPRTNQQKAATHTLDATYRPDAYLAGFAGITAGTRHGFRSKQNAFLGFQQTGFDAGMPNPSAGNRLDRWASQQQLTIDFMLSPGDLTQTTIPYTVGVILGMGSRNQEQPWLLQATPGGDANGNTQLTFSFQTGERPDWNTGFSWAFSFYLCGSNGGVTNVAPPWRITIQVDLINLTKAVWVNNVQVPLLAVNFPTTASFFKMNYVCPMTVLNGGGIALPTEVDGPNMFSDLACYGLCVSNTPRYTVSTTGSAQKTLANATPTDVGRYLQHDAHTMGCLQMSDVASGEAAKLSYRTIPVACTTAAYAQTAMGWFYSWMPGAGQSFDELQGIRINNGGNGGLLYGYGVMLGRVLDTTIRDCHITSNGYAIGTPNLEANYFLKVKDNQLFGGDSCYYAYSQEVILTDNTMGLAGNFTMKFCGCKVKDRGSSFKDYDNLCTAIFAWFAGNYDFHCDLEHFTTDTESGAPWRAMYLFQAGNNGTVVRLVNPTPIVTGRGVLIELCDMSALGQNAQPSFIEADGFQSEGGAPVLKINGPGWRGHIRTQCQSMGPRVVSTGDFGPCNVRVVERNYVRFYDTTYASTWGPPTDGGWVANAHEMPLTAPLPGMYTELRCVGSGSPGTMTPAAWQGINPVAAPFGTLCSVVPTNYAITGDPT